VAIINRFRYVFTECGYKYGDVGKVAEKIGVSKPTMSMLMNRDYYKPDLETAIRASRFFGKKVEEVFILQETE
jgi:DNA-binding XRE family transcriptional regulator